MRPDGELLRQTMDELADQSFVVLDLSSCVRYRLPLDQVVLGEHEEYVPLPLARTYVQAAERTGDRVRLMVIPGVGHFEIASPRAAIWPRVESVIRSLIDGKLPPRERKTLIEAGSTG